MSALANLHRAILEIEEAKPIGKASFEEFDDCLAAVSRLIDREKRKPAVKCTRLADELMKIGAMLTADKRFHDLASRLIDLSNQVKESGVCDDRAPESPF